MAKNNKNNITTAIAINDMNFDNNIEQNSNISILNNAIEKLALIDGNTLSDKDKDNAVEVIEDWENNVVGKLRNKSSNLKAIVSNLSKPFTYESSNLNDIQLGDLASKINNEKLYKELIKAKEEEKEYVDFNKVLKPDTSMLTRIEEIQTLSDYNASVSKYNAISRRLESITKAKRFELTGLIAKNKIIKDFILTLEKEIKATNKLKREAKEKSILAKTSIKISNEDLKSAIFDILNF